MLRRVNTQVVAKAQGAILAPAPHQQTAVAQQCCAVPVATRNLYARLWVTAGTAVLCMAFATMCKACSMPVQQLQRQCWLAYTHR